MEHIVQFAIGIDDDRITQRIEETAEKQIVETLTQEIRNKIFQSNYFNGKATAKDSLSAFTTGLIEEFLETHKDEILNKASVHLAEKLSRTKAGKALLGQE